MLKPNGAARVDSAHAHGMFVCIAFSAAFFLSFLSLPFTSSHTSPPCKFVVLFDVGVWAVGWKGNKIISGGLDGACKLWFTTL